jgi:ATP/ADP translocase
VDFGDLQAAAAAQGPFITAVTVFLIAWFTIMAITGWLAGRRNREGGLWAAFAFFAGPFALIALLLLPPKQAKPALSPLWAQLEERDARKADQAGATINDPAG